MHVISLGAEALCFACCPNLRLGVGPRQGADGRANLVCVCDVCVSCLSTLAAFVVMAFACSLGARALSAPRGGFCGADVRVKTATFRGAFYTRPQARRRGVAFLRSSCGVAALVDGCSASELS